MTPYVLIILMNTYGFSVPFESREACESVLKRIEIQAKSATCAERGMPVQAFVKAEVKSTIHKMHIASPRRRTRTTHSYWSGR